MTVLVWPTAEVPYILNASGYTSMFPDGRIKTPMDLGPPKLRKRSSGVVTPVSGVLVCTSEELGRLRRWWAEDTAYGALPFLFPEPIFDDGFLVTEGDIELTDEDGEALLVAGWSLVQFADAPRESQFDQSLSYAVAISLNKLP